MSPAKDLSCGAFSERFRVGGSPHLSPSRVGAVFGLRANELAKRVREHQSVSMGLARPLLQQYLQDLVRVLAVATKMTGDMDRAAFLLRNEPLRAFEFKTAEALVLDGRADSVVAYLTSLEAGASG